MVLQFAMHFLMPDTGPSIAKEQVSAAETAHNRKQAGSGPDRQMHFAATCPLLLLYSAQILQE